MKNFINLFFVTLSVFIVTSCSTEDKTIDELFDSVERGAVLRTISVSGNTFNITDPSSVWTVNLEEQDEQNGGLFQEIKLYARLTDNTPNNGTTPPTEALVKTIPASSFSSEGTPFGLPRGSVSASFQEALDAIGITTADVDGGDSILLRLELVLSDGRVYTNNAAGTVAGGTFYKSPFQYTNLLVCVLAEVPAGEWRVDMQDSYGDGWQNVGNVSLGIVVTLSNGSVITVGLCSPYEPEAYAGCINSNDGTAFVTIPAGITSADWLYTGDTYGENSFQIYAPSGNLVASSGVGASAAGPIALNLCQE